MSKTWPGVRLGEVLRPTYREEAVDPLKQYRLLGVRLDGRGPFLRETVSGNQTAAKKLFRVAEGDFIYSRLFACRGAFGVIDEKLNGCYVSGEFPIFESSSDRIDFKYLYYWFRLPTTLALVDADCAGSTPLTRNRFKEHFFLSLEAPLPPLLEQRRIVARIEELSAQIHDASMLRCQAVNEVEAIWPSIIKNKLLGLDCETREYAGETAESMLKSSAERNAGFNVSKFNNANPNCPNIVKEGPTRLPSSWVWTTLGSVLTHLVDCVNDTPDFCEYDTGLIGLKSTNVRPYRLDLSRKWFMTPEDFQGWNRREQPIIGDIVLTREAPMGYACIIDENINICLTQRLMLLRSDRLTILPHLLLHYLNSPIFYAQVSEHCRGLTTPHIRVQDAPRFLLPLPPSIEQHRIVAELDTLQEEGDCLKRLQADTAAEIDALLPAILDRAFKGEL